MAASFEEIKLDNPQNGAFDTMNEYRKKNLFCDVNLDTNGTLFPCHRIILTASSTYFQVMFNGNFKESSLKVIPIKDIDADIMEILLSAIYTRQIRLVPENMYFVLKASHLLQIEVIFNACVDCIMKKIAHIHYLPEICSFAKTIGAQKLYNRCIKILSWNVFRWEKTDAFLNLSYDTLKDVLSKVIPFDDNRDDDLLAIIIKWCKYNHTNTQNIRVLMKTCKFSRKPTSALAELMFAARDSSEIVEDEIQSSNHCDFNWNLYLHTVDVKNGARGWGSLKLNESFSNYTLSNFQAMDLRCSKICSIGSKTYCSARDYSTQKPIFCCFEENSRIDLQVPTDVRLYSDYEMIAVGKMIYFFHSRCGTNIWDYDCELDTWQSNTFHVLSPVSPSNNSLKSVLYDYYQWSNVTCLDRSLYVIGCRKIGLKCDDRYIVSIDTRAPQVRHLIAFPNPFQHENAAVCAFDGKIAISGSNHDSTLHNTFSIFDVTAGKWTTDLEPMNEGRAMHKLIHRDGFIYAVEKRPFIENEKYDVKLNTWIEIPKLPERAQFVNADGVNMTIGFGSLINAESISL